MKTLIRETYVPDQWRYMTFRRRVYHATLPEFQTVDQLVLGYSKEFEEITPNSEGGRHIWKDVEHYRRSYVLPEKAGVAESARLPSLWYDGEYPDILGHLGHSYQQGDVGKFNKDLFQHYVKRLDGGFIPEPADLELLKQSALNSTMPGIKAEMSLINSIIELKDFRSVGRSVDAVKAITSRLARLEAVPLRQLLRGVADVYLQGSFNFGPLLSDIRALKSMLSRVQKRLNDLVTRQGRVQRRHFQMFLTKEEPLETVLTDGDRSLTQKINGSSGTYCCWHSLYALSTKYRVRRYVTAEPAVFHFEIEYNYNYTQYQAENARILAYMDYLGLNLNPAIIWNAIPWTFVVDWVFGVSRWLNQFAVRQMDPLINIRRALWSVKRGRRILVTAQSVPPYGDYVTPWPETPGGVVTERSYRRSVGMPTASSIVSSGLNLKEFSLGAALVVTRRRRQFSQG